MTDTYLTLLEAISDPWALGLISFFFAGTIVVCGAIAMEPRPPVIENDCEVQTPPRFLEPLPYEPEDFFDKTTRFHREI